MPLEATDHHGNTTEIVWGEISPCEHLVQIYQDDTVILDALQGFVVGGLEAGDGVIVVATPAHLDALERRLLSAGFDPNLAALQDQYIPLDAERTLARFMTRGWPDEILFEQLVIDVLERAGQDGRRVRAFGEMVAILWAKGHTGATIRLEQLWHRMCHERGFSLFCAYPRVGFAQGAEMSIKEICATHSKVVNDN